ncbi:MAG: 3'(2'),5'-bisphosphate nucleotidase CysQ [Deltaproteobacteria bacterium]|nr:3'(2'),5'-bisphosphate nucleotidase CysQ [Deltaproteobacteria bacterium]
MSDQNNFSEELKTAEKAAREAGSIIMALYGKDYRIEEKGKGNPVTTADLEANLKIQEIIRGRYPEDGWLSEEDKDNLKRLEASRVWVVDPIDGTKEFIEGVPQFAVSVGLVVGGRPVLGVVYNPAQEMFFCAIKGGGAKLNGQPIHVAQREAVQGASLLVSRSEPRKRFKAFMEICRVETVGSIAFRLAKVGGGEGDGTLTFRSIHEWDICAGVLIVEEAGGMVVDGEGRGLVFNQQDAFYRGIVASNAALAQTLQGMLAKALSERR